MDDVEILSEPGSPRVLAISGAKGGVGKTLLATNLAIYFATVGRRVVFVDADSSGANGHTFLGLQPAVAVEGTPGRAVETSIPGLSYLRVGVDQPVPGSHRTTPMRSLADLVLRLDADADYAVVDLGSGIRGHALALWRHAEVGLFVSVPEPTSVEDTYRFLRRAFAQGLLEAMADRDARLRMRAELRAMGNFPSPTDLLRRLDAAGDSLASAVRQTMESFGFQLVLNHTKAREDLELGDAMRSAILRAFGIRINYLGYIDYDDTVPTCLRVRRPLLVESPGAKASKNIEKIARRILAQLAGKGDLLPKRGVPPESHHDLLEVGRSSSDEEIRRSYKRARAIYDSQSLCCYGLLDEERIRVLRARLEEAYDVLLDPARRKPYELSIFPPQEMTSAAEIQAKRDSEPPPPAPPITPDTDFGGALLRAVRESQAVTLAEIAARTKVGAHYLEAIETESFRDLPAPVYVRGFVTEIAKFLRLDSVQVSRTYLRRYKRFLSEQEAAEG